MPLSNLSIRAIFYDGISKLFLTHPAFCGRRLVYATQCFCGSLLVVKINELFYFSFCYVDITKIYLFVIGKLFFNGFVYSFRYSIF